MYVCLCKAVTDSQIRNAAENGCQSMKALAQELGVATQCGKCGMYARALLKEAQETTATLYRAA